MANTKTVTGSIKSFQHKVENLETRIQALSKQNITTVKSNPDVRDFKPREDSANSVKRKMLIRSASVEKQDKSEKRKVSTPKRADLYDPKDKKEKSRKKSDRSLSLERKKDSKDRDVKDVKEKKTFGNRLDVLEKMYEEFSKRG